MKTKLKASALLTITALLAISVVAISEMPEAEAKKDHDEKKQFKKLTKGKPDFVAKINTPNNAEHHNGEKGTAKFWVTGEGDNMKIAYIVKLKKIDVGKIGEDGNGQEPTKRKYAHYLWKLHVHPAPYNEMTEEYDHDPSVHHFNAIGPADDSNIDIKRKTITGIWDKSDFDNRADLPHNHHETVAPNTVIEQMCAGDTDINVHLEHASHLEVRGQIFPTSKFCDSI